MAQPMTAKPAEMIRPPLFGDGAAADTRRMEFDLQNGVLVTNHTPVDVVFIGDSITHFWEVNAYFHRFGLVINRGIGGDVAHILARRFEGDVIQLHPRACVIMVGINNTWCLDDPATDEGDVLRLVADSYRRMLDMARDNGVKMLVCSVMPIGISNENDRRRNRLVVRINAALEDLCGEYGATYVDYYHAMADEDGEALLPGLSDDNVHPHVIGYNRMAAVLTPLLEQALQAG